MKANNVIIDRKVFKFRIYDISIKDIEERRKRSVFITGVRKTANFLGVSESLVESYSTKTAILKKKRLYSERLETLVAIRKEN